MPLVLFDMRTGREVRRLDGVHVDPQLGGTAAKPLLYTTTGKEIVALDPAGNEVGRFAPPQAEWAFPFVDGERLVVAVLHPASLRQRPPYPFVLYEWHPVANARPQRTIIVKSQFICLDPAGRIDAVVSDGPTTTLDTLDPATGQRLASVPLPLGNPQWMDREGDRLAITHGAAPMNVAVTLLDRVAGTIVEFNAVRSDRYNTPAHLSPGGRWLLIATQGAGGNTVFRAYATDRLRAAATTLPTSQNAP